MNFGLSLVRFALGIAALWLIATAYQNFMVHEVTTAEADPPRIAPAFAIHPVEWSNCSVDMNAPGTSSQNSSGCTGLDAQQGQGAIPRN